MHLLNSVIFSLVPAVAAGPLLGAAPLVKRTGDIVPRTYIVKFKDGITEADSVDAMSGASEVHHVFKHVFHGYAAILSDTALIELRARPDIDFVEHDAIFHVNGYVEQPNAEWGLSRISHRKRSSGAPYVYDDSAGAGACAYVIDTGIDGTHLDFGGRASQIKTFVGGPTDGNGHGTHLAGIIGSKTYGVAKKATIYGVKVLDDNGSGTHSNVIAGMDFVAKDAETRANCTKGAAVNLSIGGPYSAAVNKAAASLVQSGVFVSVSAGGEGSDAGNVSPGSEPTVCTIGSSTMADGRASNSNYGSVLDLFAPGDRIKSTWVNGQVATLSGTSMAAAHVSGLGVYLAALEGFPGGQQMCERIRELATKDVLSNVPAGTPNLLAFNGNPSG